MRLRVRFPQPFMRGGLFANEKLAEGASGEKTIWGMVFSTPVKACLAAGSLREIDKTS